MFDWNRNLLNKYIKIILSKNFYKFIGIFFIRKKFNKLKKRKVIKCK